MFVPHFIPFGVNFQMQTSVKVSGESDGGEDTLLEARPGSGTWHHLFLCLDLRLVWCLGKSDSHIYFPKWWVLNGDESHGRI